MSIRSELESLELSCHSRMAHVSLAQTFAVTVASYLWLLGESRLSLEMLLRCSTHQLPLIAEAVTGLNFIFKHLVGTALWAQMLWHLLADFKNSQEALRSSAFVFSLLKESRSGLCSLAALQNGLSWVVCSSTCFIFLQTWVILWRQWVIIVLPSFLHLPVAVFWENTWQIIII